MNSVSAMIKQAWEQTYKTEEIAYQESDEWFIVHYYGRYTHRDKYLAWHACAPHMIRSVFDVGTHVHPASNLTGCKARAQCLQCSSSVPNKLKMLVKIFNMKGVNNG